MIPPLQSTQFTSCSWAEYLTVKVLWSLWTPIFPSLWENKEPSPGVNYSLCSRRTRPLKEPKCPVMSRWAKHKAGWPTRCWVLGSFISSAHLGLKRAERENKPALLCIKGSCSCFLLWLTLLTALVNLCFKWFLVLDFGFFFKPTFSKVYFPATLLLSQKSQRQTQSLWNTGEDPALTLLHWWYASLPAQSDKHPHRAQRRLWRADGSSWHRLGGTGRPGWN